MLYHAFTGLVLPLRHTVNDTGELFALAGWTRLRQGMLLTNPSEIWTPSAMNRVIVVCAVGVQAE
jgi:hypothetical protein